MRTSPLEQATLAFLVKAGIDAATSNLYGMYLLGSSSLSTSTGNITLNGTGGNGATTNYGVYLDGVGVSITTSDGDIDITAQGSNGTGASNYGIRIKSATIESTGVGAASAGTYL